MAVVSAVATFTAGVTFADEVPLDAVASTEAPPSSGGVQAEPSLSVEPIEPSSLWGSVLPTGVTGQFAQQQNVDPAAGANELTEGYVSLVPARLLDTRADGVTVDGRFAGGGTVAAAGQVDLPVVGRGGVPASGVGAVVVNVTVTEPSGPGFVTVFPAGSDRPNASSLNFVPGQTVPNLVVAKVGTGGQISLFSLAGTHLIVDVVGYFPVTSDLTPLVPARLLDTRADGVTVDGRFAGGGTVAAAGQVDLPVVGRGGVPASGVGAVVVNVTVTQPSGPGFVTVFPAGSDRPNASSLNFVPGQTVPNLVVAKVGTGGQISLFSLAGTHLIVDVVGFFPLVSDLTPLVPARLLDTRADGVTVDGRFAGGGTVAAAGQVDLPVVGRGGVPASGVGAVVVNVTVTQPSGPGFVTVFPAGSDRPNASSLNFVPGQTVPNLVVAKVGTGGQISLFSLAGTHLIVDVVGYFTVAKNQVDLSVSSLLPPTTPVNRYEPGGSSELVLPAGSSVDVGDVVILEQSSAYPQGLIGRVQSIVDGPGGRVVTTTPGSVLDVIPQLSLTVDLETGQPKLDGVPATTTPSARTEGPERTETTPKRRTSFKANCKESFSSSIELDADVELGDLHITGDGLRPSSVWVAIWLEPEISVEFEAEMTGKLTCNASLTLPDINLPSINTCVPAPIGCIPFNWQHRLIPRITGTFTAEASASYQAKWKTTAKIGQRFGKNGGDIREYQTTTSLGPSAEARVTGEVYARIQYEGAGYGILGIGVGLGPVVKLEAGTGSADWLRITAALRGEVYAFADIKIRRWETDRFTVDIPRDGWELFRIRRPQRPLFAIDGVSVTIPDLAAGESWERDIVVSGRTEIVVAFRKTTASCQPSTLLIEGEGVNNRVSSCRAANRVVLPRAGRYQLTYRSASGQAESGTQVVGSVGLAPVGIALDGPVVNSPALLPGQFASWTFPVSSGERFSLAITVAGAASCDLPELRVFSPSGTQLHFAACGNGSTFDHTATATGTYRIEIQDASALGQSPGAMSFALTRPAGSGPGSGQESGVLAAGHDHTCALPGSGGVKCWGRNGIGQLGNGSLVSSSTPVDVSGLTSGVVSISAGGSNTCALTSVGGVKCWGSNLFGELGNGSTARSTTPVDVVGLTSGVVAISLGTYHTCALTSAGGVKCWGWNNAGRLGNGSTVNSVTPVDVVGLTSGVVSINAGGSHTCALTAAGGVKCWGDNSGGQLGNGSQIFWGESVPVDVVGLASGVVSISAGDVHTCALTSAGGVKCWGANIDGQLGIGSTAVFRTVPLDVVGLASGVAAINAGGDHTCALTSGGVVKCWGSNSSGELGDGTTIERSSPVDTVGLGVGVRSIVTGGLIEEHSCAVTAARGVKCWGGNDHGQLGNGTTVNSSTPVDVSGLTSGVGPP